MPLTETQRDELREAIRHDRARNESIKKIAAEHRGRVQLIAVGYCPAIPAEDLRLGDERIYNYGATATLVGIAPKGKASLSLTWRLDYSRGGYGVGETTASTARKTTLIPVVGLVEREATA